MSAQSHISRALAGALALARFDRKGLEYFDFSYDGFWRSFNAVAVALPIVIAATAVMPEVDRQLAEFRNDLSAGELHTPQNLPFQTLIKTIAYLAGWLFFPLAMIWLARLLRIGGRYVPLIVAWNWSRAISAYAVLIPFFLCGIGVLSVGLFAFFGFLIALYIFAYRWFVIRCAAGVPGTTALGLLLFDLVSAALVSAAVSQL